MGWRKGNEQQDNFPKNENTSFKTFGSLVEICNGVDDDEDGVRKIMEMVGDKCQGDVETFAHYPDANEDFSFVVMDENEDEIETIDFVLRSIKPHELVARPMVLLSCSILKSRRANSTGDPSAKLPTRFLIAGRQRQARRRKATSITRISHLKHG